MRDKDIEIATDGEVCPFINCKLERKDCADALTSIVSTYKDGFVLAVNGKWGSGKTTFVKMWEQSLKNSEYKTIYFNAWENDFTSEAVVAIMGEINTLTTSATENTFKSITDKVCKISSKVLPALAKTAATLSGLKPVADVIEKLSEATVEAFNDEIKDYDKKKESLKELKTELSEFVKNSCNGKPLVFIVDELDRCRPDYAVEVLEKIKHFFSVDGIVFVLSIDKEQLGYAIQGHYGSSLIDSNEYLRRFIDVEYVLPEPKYDDFCKYLYDKYGFADFFEQDDRQRYYELKFDKNYFFRFINSYCSEKKFTLRQLEKFFIHTRIILRTLSATVRVSLEIIFTLVVLKECNNSLYENLKNGDCDIKTIAIKLEDELGDYMLPVLHHDYPVYPIFELIFSLLMKFYSIELDYNNQPNPRLFIREQNNDTKLTFTLTRIENARILELLQSIGERNNQRLSYYTNKIDLLEQLQS